MHNCLKNILVAALLLTIFSGTLFAKEGFIPRWKIGDRWILEASYRDMRLPGEVWMAPIQWIFKVRNIKTWAGQKCYVLHIFPKSPEIKAQAILWLAVDDLRPLRVIDIYPTSKGVKSMEREIDPNNPQPLLAEDTLVPYDLPIFPLVRANRSLQNADGFNAYRSTSVVRKFDKVTKVGGLSFKRTTTQKIKTPDKQYADSFAAYRSGSINESFQVELTEPRTHTSLIQLWQDGSPWAISSESSARKIRLLPPKLPTEPQHGGEE